MIITLPHMQVTLWPATARVHGLGTSLWPMLLLKECVPIQRSVRVFHSKASRSADLTRHPTPPK